MNGEARPNVGKMVSVFASSYLGLRAQYPNAFAIQPTRTGECDFCGEHFARVVEVTDPRTGEVVESCGRCRDRRGIA